MTFPDAAALVNLASIGNFESELSDTKERTGLLRLATVRFQNAKRSILSLESRFDVRI